MPAAPMSSPVKSCARPCLACAARGQPVQVVAVDGDDVLARRLADHGLWLGTTVEKLTTAPLGDPMLFRLRGYRLALRRDEAARVLVAPVVAAP